VTLHPHLQTKHLHHKANSIGSGHAAPDKEFLTQVTSALADAGEILIIGPAGAKTELAKYLREQHPAIGKRIVAVEAADHPTDGEIVAYAKHHFKMAPARVATRG
jgi:DNA-binding MurR/RpiR family transcriptional regulator